MPALFLAAALIGISASYVVFEILPARQAAAAQAAGWNALHFTDAAAAEDAIREYGWWPA